MSPYAIAGIGFTILSLVIGLYAATFVKGRVAGYYVAGRQAGGWFIWGTYLGTWISVGTFLGVATLVWQLGPVRGMWNYGSLWGIGVFAFFIAIALRRARLLTVPDIFWEMWRNKAIHIIAVLILISMMWVYTVGQILAMGKIYQWIFNFDFTVGTVLFTAIVATYVVVGGMWADITTDLVQTVTFVVAALVAAPMAIAALGGWPALTNQLVQMKPGVWDFDTPQHFPLGYLIGLFFSWLAFTAATPHLITRAYSAKSEVGLVKGLIGSQLAATIFLWFFFAAASGVFLQQQRFDDPDFAGVYFLQNLLPVPIGMLMVGAMMAAALSTVDSLALMIGQGVARDIYQRYINPHVHEGQLLLISRIAVAASIVLAMFGALSRPALVIWVLQFAAAVFLATYFPAIILGLYWKRATGIGVLVGMIAGLIVYPTLQLFEAQMGAVKFATTYIVSANLGGFLAGLLVMIVVSLLTKSSPDEAARIAGFRRRCFPEGKILALHDKVTPGDWQFLWGVVAVNVIFLVVYFYLLTT
ncbi:MAG: sodium:solute symporter family protein [Chloroflexi bacterium]|nr:sodium:solute symporter family protein [Chloroflexota bacterium]